MNAAIVSLFLWYQNPSGIRYVTTELLVSVDNNLILLLFKLFGCKLLLKKCPSEESILVPFCFTTSDLAFASIEPLVLNLVQFNFLNNKKNILQHTTNSNLLLIPRDISPSKRKKIYRDSPCFNCLYYFVRFISTAHA